MPNLEDCVIQFEDPNPTMTRVENAPAGIGADIVFPVWNRNIYEVGHYLLLGL